MSDKPVIGLEIHVELNTQTKMFCRCLADYFGAEPNTHTCPVCLGLPGALPYPNKKAIEDCIMIALALNCKIANYSYFERKNYFYPDLAKGFQISQYLHPFGEKGFLTIENKGEIKKIRITRVHMEEDTGKLTHEGTKSLIDFNRSGVPLVEIVTEPDIANGEEARLFLQKLQRVIRYVGVSDADMEKGHMRLEPNISLIIPGSNQKMNGEYPGYKVEVKNINSFRFVEKAINYELVRQKEILEKGETPTQETRGWNEGKNATLSQRSKEEAHDYRYFPEPDIPPISFTDQQIIEFTKSLPELPDTRYERFMNDYGLNAYNAQVLVDQKERADFFEIVVKQAKEKNIEARDIANFIINKKVDSTSQTPDSVIEAIYNSKQVTSIDEEQLEKAITESMSENEKAVSDYKSGKEGVLGFLIGMVRKKLGAQNIDMNVIREKLVEKLSK